MIHDILYCLQVAGIGIGSLCCIVAIPLGFWELLDWLYS